MRAHALVELPTPGEWTESGLTPDTSRDGPLFEPVVAPPEKRRNLRLLTEDFLQPAQSSPHNPYHQRDMLSISIKFAVAAGNSETTTTPRSRLGTSDGARLRRPWTRALSTKCSPRPMPQRRYAKQRTCRCLTTGGDRASAWNTKTDALQVLFCTPTSPSPTHHHSQKPHPSSLPKRGVGMGVGWAYDPGKGPPKTRAGHVLTPQCGGNSNHPYEDNAKLTWQTSKTGKTRPTARAPQPPNPSGSPVEVFDLIALWTHNYLWE
ncbi:hypothetical protein THAOC_14343 [Thalassiosira oceanica]|uniref:Uncharacterized protein n=1 Tax=Thalassiosira oceanica TaxID=159749 RepID=K0SFF8_THAOC|nr:hypothetical protein THAOC_14343 [Thalassiosira oceanica]|eukprot:EJK64873.1 hypothetical protein THAOC_14343 [Thalassiosira oceanica]